MNKFYAICSTHMEEIVALEARQDKFLSEVTPELKASLHGDDDEGYDKPYQVVSGIALFDISGKMLAKGNMFTRWLGIPTYDSIGDAFAQMSQDPEVKKVLISMGTPGGHVAGISDLSDSWRRLNATKPITVHTSSMLASAGIWLSSNSTSIFASEVAEVGSIGVVMQHVSQEKMLRDSGYKVTEIKSSPLKHLGSPAFDLTPEEEAVLQAKVMESNELFKKQMYRTRPKISAEAFTGDTFSASNSLRIGLIDGIKTYTEVFEQLSASADSRTINANDGGTFMKKRYATQAMADAAITAGADSNFLIVVSEAVYAEKNLAGTLEFDDGTPEAVVVDPEAVVVDPEASVIPDEAEESTAEAQLAEAKSLLEASEATIKTLEASLAQAEELYAASKATADKLQASAEVYEGLRNIAEGRLSQMRMALGLVSIDTSEFSDSAILAEHTATETKFKKAFIAGGRMPVAVKGPAVNPSMNSVDAARLAAVGVN